MSFLLALLNMSNNPEDYARPTRRPLKIFAFDPMLGRVAGNRVTVQIPNEPDLKP